MYGVGHFPLISPVGAPPHIGPIVKCCPPVVCCYPPVRPGVAIIAVAILILLAIAIIF